ncbi:histidine phosphatase family protein [Prosthecochloris sp. HL-130-GSB]|jgi:phosphohistidine phosphatase|uniref:Phosphohistidine phosphatase n=1 Tax=Prosthecochloris aestuarii TaxID=1102 RepID=A0A831WUM9_PROAE|nr:histidine phosphatase family protein [Prosthecochloris sp. HL-130-GSB]ARM31675.1 phosphohistidine phosphatase [Prosthecochloris sp. HL-130-GSB]MBO8093079.1 histidine phosphatase family protein [Prosthecochloris sp.]HED30459.1 phosphohistidine phosphatase [Prosthecochloris aestuarii]
MKTLYLVRHAKSSWDNANMADFDRPLNKRGMKAAPFMANLLKEKAVAPDLIISSPANRALTTAEIFAETLDYPVEEIRQQMEIYEGGINHCIRIIHNIPDTVSTAMLFGHNPTLTLLANFLSGEHIENIVTCGVVELALKHENWHETMMDSATLGWYEYPKKHQEE